jgi:hypothetical protein
MPVREVAQGASQRENRKVREIAEELVDRAIAGCGEPV